MTLIATVVTPLFIVQAADRRLTTEKYKGQFEIYDRNSNKSIIYEASDGLLTIGYCGAAFIENIPTDEWIAKKLHPGVRDMFDRGLDPWSVSLFPQDAHTTLTVDRVLQLLREEFDGFAQSVVASHGVSIAVSGWRLRGAAIEPVFVEFRRSKGSTAVKADGYKAIPWRPGNSVRSFIGTGNRDDVSQRFDESWDAIHRGASDRQYRGLDAYLESVRGAMVDAIRFASKVDPTVGPDVHISTLPKPQVGAMYAETHSDTTSTHPATIHIPSPENSQRQIHVPDAAVTGWVLLNGIAEAPAYLVGGHAVAGRSSRVYMHGAEKQGNVGGFFQTIRRRRV